MSSRTIYHRFVPELPYPRRKFLLQAAGAGLAGGVLCDVSGRAWAFAPPPSAAELIPGKDARLLVHSADPLELETPLSLLAEHGTTPKSLLFVRNNQVLAGANNLKPSTERDWKVELGGMVEYPATLALAELEKMDQVEYEMVLQCSGNGRSYFSQSAPAKGSQWQSGAMGNVRFRGVPLRNIVEQFKLNASPQARFLTAEGADGPSKLGSADFEHSIPLDDALERSILALQLNGEALPAVHGGPLRLVTPGYYGTMHVKWLSRLRFEAHETANHHQIKRYRTPTHPIRPGDKFESDGSNSEPNWRMKIKSVFFAPDSKQPITAGSIEVRGVAWNDGAARITSVEITTDGARSWHGADLTTPESPYAWYPWKTRLTLAPGKHTLQVRAVDRLGRTQPLDGAVHWNPAGYAWNGVESLDLNVKAS
jgi:DMSO/TMAO reductase YedYZ molybdopterin-dependent catalytic subunit